MLDSIDKIKEYLEYLLGKSNVAIENSRGVVLPLYLNCYDYAEISVYGNRYIFVSAKESLNVKTYKAQKGKIEALFDCPAVLVLEKSKALQRQNLIQNNIMFVEIGKQLFMPTVGLALQNVRDIVIPQVDKFTPQTQLCALFFLYHRVGEYTVKQIAEKTQLNSMSISRGMNSLRDLELLSNASIGRTSYYRLSVDKREYLQKLERYSVSPVQKAVWIKKDEKSRGVFRAGYSALSAYSMLADNEYETYAISKEEYKQIDRSLQIEFEDFLDEQDFIKLEVWKYDPALFAEEGTVDKFSLCMSFDQEHDERTEAILKEIKESIING